MSEPTVSVLIPNYRYEHYIGHAIDSVRNQYLNQGWDYEVVICDDYSPRRYLLSEACSLEKLDSWFLLQHTSNKGVGATLQTCLESARGKYIAILSADDCFPLSKFKTQIREMEDQDLDMSYGDMKCFGMSDRIVIGKPLNRENLLSLRSPCPCPTLMFKREVVQDLGGFDATLRHAEDLDLVWRLFDSNYKWAYIPKILGYYRVHPGQKAQIGELIGSMNSARRYILDKARSRKSRVFKEESFEEERDNRQCF